MNSPSVLMLNHNIVRRGTFFRCLNFAKPLSEAGFDVTLVTASDEPRLRSRVWQSGGVTIIETPRIGKIGEHDGGWAPEDILYRTGHVLRHHYDIVHAFSHRPNVSLPWYLSRKFQKSVHLADWADWWCRGGILTSRRPFAFLDHWEGNLEEGIKKSADRVTVTSRILQDRAQKIGISPERILYLPSGADVEQILPMDKESARRSLEIDPKAKVIVFVGHALWDLSFLMDAFRLVQRSLPGCLLYLVGSDWKEMGEIIRNKDGIQADIRVVGQVLPEDLSLHLAVADVHALPLQDTLANRARGPIKLGDYMASGRPVVTQNIGEAGALVASEGIGVVTEASSEAFAEGLLELLQDRDNCDRLGKRAREIAAEKYTWRQCAKPLIDLYRSLL